MSIEQTTYHVEIFTMSDLRYQGHLYTVDLRANTIGLSRVRCYGTENRGDLIQLAPQGIFYNFVQFRIPDVKQVWLIDEEGGKTLIDIQMLLEDKNLQKQRKSQTDVLSHYIPDDNSMTAETAANGNEATLKGVRPVTLPLIDDTSEEGSQSAGAIGKRKPTDRYNNVTDNQQFQNTKIVNAKCANDKGRYNSNPYDRHDGKELVNAGTGNHGNNNPFESLVMYARNGYYNPHVSGSERRNANNSYFQQGAAKEFTSSYKKEKDKVANNPRFLKNCWKPDTFATSSQNDSVSKGLKLNNDFMLARDYNFESTNNTFEEIRTRLAKIDISKTSSAERDLTEPTYETSDEKNSDCERSHKVGYNRTHSFFDNLTPPVKPDLNPWHDAAKVNQETFGFFGDEMMLNEGNSRVGRYKIDYSADFSKLGTHRRAEGGNLLVRDRPRVGTDRDAEYNGTSDQNRQRGSSRPSFARYRDTNLNFGHNGRDFNIEYNDAENIECNASFGHKDVGGYNRGNSKSEYNDGNSNFGRTNRIANSDNMREERGNTPFQRGSTRNSYRGQQYACLDNRRYERGTSNAEGDSYGAGSKMDGDGRDNNNAGWNFNGAGRRNHGAGGDARGAGRDTNNAAWESNGAGGRYRDARSDTQSVGRDNNDAGRRTYDAGRSRTDFEYGGSYSNRGRGLQVRGRAINRRGAKFNNPESFADITRGQ